MIKDTVAPLSRAHKFMRLEAIAREEDGHAHTGLLLGALESTLESVERLLVEIRRLVESNEQGTRLSPETVKAYRYWLPFAEREHAGMRTLVAKRPDGGTAVGDVERP